MTEKQKKPIFKRWWFWLIIVIVAIAAVNGGGEDKSADVAGEPAVQPTEQADTAADDKPEVINEPEKTEEPGETEEPEKTEEPADDVPREYKNALRSAQNYVDTMPFSEKGLFGQLTSEYGEQYPEEAAQYAIENVKVNYNEEALEAAINYQEVMPMSDKELFDQLISEYGDQFTEEQAQYAVDNLAE